MASPYSYKRLNERIDEIRLATIFPGTFNDSIRLSITHTPLHNPKQRLSSRLPLNQIDASLPLNWDALETLEGRVLFESPENVPDFTSWLHPDPAYPRASYEEPDENDVDKSIPKYEALSYTWGSVSNLESATIDALNQPSTLPLGQNLTEALRYLRYPDRPRTLWIDAICINQEDLIERSHQVLRMGSIYKLASRVILWLGPAADDSQMALSKLQFLGEQVEYTRNRRFIPSPKCQEPDWFSSGYDLPYIDEDWEAIYHLTGRSWFERLWVLQEAQLANRKSIMKCGEQEIPWPLFRRAVLCLQNKKAGPPKRLRPQLRRSATSCRFLQGMTLSELLLAATSRKCKDPRDKIFGILSIAPPNFTSQVRPDYSLSVMDVYKQTFLTYTTLTKRLSLLQQCSKRDNLWPSWVPNWAEVIMFNGTINVGFCASGISSSVEAATSHGLKVVGIKFATISSSEIMQIQTIADIIEVLRGLDVGQLHQNKYPSGGTVLDAYLHSFTIGTLRDRMPKRRDPTLQEWRDQVIQQVTLNLKPPSSRSFSRFENDIVNRVSGQAIIKTNNHYMGLGPRNCEAGDYIFIALGCEIPIILRPTPAGEYEVIGNCFLHGIMDGEAILGPFNHPWGVRVALEKDGIARPSYFNLDTQATASEDPRLDRFPLPPNWVPMEWDRTREDPIFCRKFRNTMTGESINSDPRLLPEALTAQGIKVEEVELI